MSNNEQTERDIDKILISMNEGVEDSGVTIGAAFFNFEDQNRDIQEENNWDDDYFYKLLKKCISRGFIKHQSMTDKFIDLVLTESGQGRAISASLGKDRHYELDEAKMKIMSLNIYGTAQIGDNNIQNNADFFSAVLNEVEKSDAREEEKEKARRTLNDYRNNHLIQSAIKDILGG